MQKKLKWLLLMAALMSLLLLVVGCNDSSNQENKGDLTEKEQVSAEATEKDEQRIIAGTVVIAEIMDKLGLDAIAVPETEKKLAKRFE